MKIRTMRSLCALAFAAGAASVLAGPIGANHVVVIQVGADNRVSNVTNAAMDQYLKEYTKLGVFVQSIPLPVSVSGNNRRMTQSGTATSNGHLNLSVNGQFLTLCGYDADFNTAGVANTPVTTVNRIIGRVSIATGDIDSSTFLDAQYNADNMRDAITVDGTSYYTAGNSTPSGTGGVWYVSHGSPLDSGAFRDFLAATPNNTRKVNIANGQLYVSTSTSTPENYRGVNTIGTGIPTTVGQATTLLPGFDVETIPTSLSPSHYDFAFIGTDTLYVADDRTGVNAPRNGIQKWRLESGVWVYKYSLRVGINSTIRSLAAEEIAPGVVQLYTTTGENTANKLVTISDAVTDSSNGTSFTVLATAPTFTVWRGVELIPNDASPTNTVTGVVDFGNVGPTYNSGPFPGSIPVSFRDAANNEIATGSASYNAVTGAFSAVVPGAVTVPYRVSFKLGFWLRKTLPNPSGPAAPLGNYNFGTVAPLVGDADDDNEITNSDYALWAASNGNSVAANTDCDFDGDGEITNSDYALWASTNGNSGDN